jgi:putative oxidoreductase
MKNQTIIYWLATVSFCLWIILNAYFYLTSEEAKRTCRHFGFPDYFRVELAFAKTIGVVVLLLPILKGRIKEWAYSGFVITVISGFIAHVFSGDSIPSSLSTLIALVILLASYFSYHKLNPTQK